MRILLFLVNSVLKSLLDAFTRVQKFSCSVRKKTSNEFHQGALTITLFGDFFRHSFKT